MAFNRKADGSSTSLSRNVMSEKFDELKAMVQTLAMSVQNSTAAATATASAVAAMGEEVKRAGCDCEGSCNFV